jgi:hypothetical protein
VDPSPSAPSVAELEGPLDREERAAVLTRAAPPEADRAERKLRPAPLPAEEASDSLPEEKPELLDPPPLEAPDVLASAEPAEATELPDPPEVPPPPREEPDERSPPPPPPETVTTAIPPRPDIWIAIVPPEDPPRPPRSDGAINDTYFSAAVTPVSRNVFSIVAVWAGAVRTATTLACFASSCRCFHVQ